jgi:hypothetical protein
MDVGKSSYRFKPKAPGNVKVQTHIRDGREVKEITLKLWQREALMVLATATLGFLRAFCGSGKTIVARAIAAHKILRTGKRQVFCVPKNDIGNDGFASHFDLNLPWKKGSTLKVHCVAPRNFCSPRSASKIDELIRILCQDPLKDDCSKKNRIGTFMQIVVTHQCLVLAYRKIRENPADLERFFANNTFWIDEGHHIKGHDESAEEKATMNHLGRFVNDAMGRANIGVELFVMTATPYRGDDSRLFSTKQLDDFVIYSLDFLEHFPTLGIEQVDVEMEEYLDARDVARKVARKVAGELDGHYHLVLVPSTGNKWRRNNKDVEILFDAIYEGIMSKTGCDLAAAKGMVCDLVTPATQRANQRLLRQEPKSGDKHPPRFKVVVACQLLKEGSDLCPVDRLHNTTMEKSPPVIYQTNGRLFRQFPGKRQVAIHYYVEKFKSVVAGKREFVSDWVNRVLYYMLMDDLVRPIMVKVPPFVPANKKERRRNRSRSSLEQIFAHEYQDMKEFLLTSMAEVDFTEKAVDFVISHALERYLPKNRSFNKGEKTQIRMALKAFLLRCRSSKMRDEGVDVSFIRKNGFDSVVEQNKLDGNMFTSGLNPNELKRFRETVEKVTFTEEQKRAIVVGVGKMVDKRTPGAPRLGNEYLDAMSKALHEFDHIQRAYNQSSQTKEFTLESVAGIVKKPADHVRKMMELYNRFLPKEINFDWKKEGLAEKVVCFGEVA